MLVLLSPARNVRPDSRTGAEPERPLYLREACRIAEAVTQYDPWELESLLDIGPERALDFYDFYRRFDPGEKGTPALLSFYGASYRNLNAQDFSSADFDFAQKHLRILSALYGLLRPKDGILPYRLGIKRDFRVDGRDLYGFWNGLIYRELFQSGEPVVSLASADYTKLACAPLSPRDTLVTCRFLVQGPNGARGTVAGVRIARGQMARFLVKNRITEPEGLKSFDRLGYRFSESLSKPACYVFIRDPLGRGGPF